MAKPPPAKPKPSPLEDTIPPPALQTIPKFAPSDDEDKPDLS